jgi:hypothetical protein
MNQNINENSNIWNGTIETWEQEVIELYTYQQFSSFEDDIFIQFLQLNSIQSRPRQIDRLYK